MITGEVYEHIVYAPHKHIYFSTLPNMRDRTIMCGSLSKTYSITGWRLGYVIAAPHIIETVKKVHDFLTVGAAAPLQEAAVVGLNFGYDYYADLQRKYTEKRNLFLEGLDRLNIPHTVPGSSFFKEPENRYIKLHFAKKNETLYDALNRLEKFSEKMK